MVNLLSREQHVVLNHVIGLVQNGHEPMHTFLTGPAGARKLVLLRTFISTLLMIFNQDANDPDTPSIASASPLAHAASDIGGGTIHGTFRLKVKDNSFNHKGLSSGLLNQAHLQWRDVQMLIIDEISTVGYGKAHQARLREFKGSNARYRGISVLKCGDLYQMQPIAHR